MHVMKIQEKIKKKSIQGRLLFAPNAGEWFFYFGEEFQVLEKRRKKERKENLKGEKKKRKEKIEKYR